MAQQLILVARKQYNNMIILGSWDKVGPGDVQFSVMVTQIQQLQAAQLHMPHLVEVTLEEIIMLVVTVEEPRSIRWKNGCWRRQTTKSGQMADHGGGVQITMMERAYMFDSHQVIIPSGSRQKMKINDTFHPGLRSHKWQQRQVPLENLLACLIHPNRHLLLQECLIWIPSWSKCWLH